jgi:hypothetical protein
MKNEQRKHLYFFCIVARWGKWGCVGTARSQWAGYISSCPQWRPGWIADCDTWGYVGR